jgi:predicted ferric reductase
MLKQLQSPKNEAANDSQSMSSNLWYRLALSAGTAGALAVVLLPVLHTSGITPDASAHITKASAFVAYVLLWVSMLAGLSITGKVGRNRMTMRFGLHRYTSLLGLGFALMHALALLGDRYMSYTPLQLLVPFTAGSYKPHWLGIGQVALYSLAAVALSFYFRGRLGVRTWRLVHSLSFALFLMALIHGLQSGSDSGSVWAQALYWISGLSVLVGAVYRALAARKGRARELAATTGLVLAGGRAQSRTRVEA